MTDANDARRALLQAVDADDLPRLPERACSYLPSQIARERAFLADRLDGETYHDLMDRGFRRNGALFYAPACPSCRQCVPLRVSVADFAPSRSQRRVWRRNRDVQWQVRPPRFHSTAFDLYWRYLQYRFPDSAADASVDEFRRSLYARVVDTREIVYTLAGQTVAISIVDVCSRSVSAVYHFYDPDHRDRSLGVFSALAEIEWARSLGVPWYYLGFWVAGSRTMAYKANYRPHELLVSGRWQRHLGT